MNLKKILLLASMALAAVAVAGPASASASGMFYHEGKAITDPVQVTFSGTIGFEVTGVGSFHCSTDATVTTTTSGGTLNELDLDTDSCVGAGALAGCELEDDELTSAATITPTAAGDVDITNLNIYNTFNAACALPDEVEIRNDPSGAAATLTPDNDNAISGYTVGGSVVDFGRAHGGTYAAIATAHATGSVAIAAPNAGTFGVTAP